MADDKEIMHAFIRANHLHLTISDMAEELSNDNEDLEKLKTYIRNFCKSHDLIPIKRGEQISNFISDFSHWDEQKLSNKLNISLPEVRLYASKLGLVIKKPKKVVHSLECLDRETQEEMLLRYRKLDMNRKKEIKENRGKTIYNQSGTELLDELRGIKSTERIKKYHQNYNI